jgi:hypothetical protein
MCISTNIVCKFLQLAYTSQTKTTIVGFFFSIEPSWSFTDKFICLFKHTCDVSCWITSMVDKGLTACSCLHSAKADDPNPTNGGC